MGVLKETTENKIRISGVLFAYTAYIVFLSITDLLAISLFYGGWNQFLWGAILAAAVCTVILAKKFSKYCVFERIVTHRALLLYGTIFLVVGILRGLAPDLSHDVSQGRVYWQTPGFADNIDENVFPAGFTFFFPLSDRIFYYPRLLLGYRMGTLTNAALLILIFIQMSALLHTLLGKQMLQLRKEYAEKAVGKPLYGILVYLISEDLLAFISVSLFYSLANLGTYMIDLVAIPLLLWLLCRVLEGRKNDAGQAELLFVALLCGLIFALKFTNVIFIAPLLLLYLLQNREVIHPGVFFAALVLGILPAAPYLLYAYTSTGNPVFWTFNAVFKSPYYPDTNFKDTRWGPQTLIELLLWPIHIILHPTERISEISKWPQIYLLIGILSGGYVLIKAWIAKQIRRESWLAVLFFAFTLLWLKSTGYPRYAILCETIAVVLAAYLVVNLLQSKKVWKKGTAIFLLIALLLQCGLNTVGGMLNYYDWSFRERISKESLSDYYSENITWLLRDRGLIGTQEQREKIDVFLSTHVRHNIMLALDPDAAIINGSYIVNQLGEVKEQKDIDYAAYYFGKLKEQEKTGAGIFDIAVASEYDSIITGANSVGAEIISLEEVDGYFVGRDTPILVGYSMTGKENTCTDLSQHPTFVFPQGTEKIRISGIACLPSYVQWEAENPVLQVTVSSADGTAEVLTVEIPQHEYICLNETIDLSAFSRESNITVTLNDASGQGIAGNIINLEVVAQ